MTNGDKIRNMTDQELAEYVYSVYIAGKMAAVAGVRHPAGESEVYIDWLKEVAND